MFVHSDLFVSLGRMLSRFTHDLRVCLNSLPFKAESYSIAYLYHILLMH